MAVSISEGVPYKFYDPSSELSYNNIEIVGLRHKCFNQLLDANGYISFQVYSDTYTPVIKIYSIDNVELVSQSMKALNSSYFYFEYYTGDLVSTDTGLKFIYISVLENGAEVYRSEHLQLVNKTGAYVSSVSDHDLIEDPGPPIVYEASIIRDITYKNNVWVATDAVGDVYKCTTDPTDINEWSLVYQIGISAAQRIEILDDGTIIVIGNDAGAGVCYRSTDGGSSFSSVTLPSVGTSVGSIRSLGSFVLVGGAGGYLAKSTDYGASFTSVSGITNIVTDILIISANVFWVACNSNELEYTTNGGSSFTNKSFLSVNYGRLGYFNGFVYVLDNTNNDLYRSNDTNNWSLTSALSATISGDIEAFNNTLFFNSNGDLYSTQDGINYRTYTHSKTIYGTTNNGNNIYYASHSTTGKVGVIAITLFNESKYPLTKLEYWNNSDLNGLKYSPNYNSYSSYDDGASTDLFNTSTKQVTFEFPSSGEISDVLFNGNTVLENRTYRIWFYLTISDTINTNLTPRLYFYDNSNNEIDYISLDTNPYAYFYATGSTKLYYEDSFDFTVPVGATKAGIRIVSGNSATTKNLTITFDYYIGLKMEIDLKSHFWEETDDEESEYDETNNLIQRVYNKISVKRLLKLYHMPGYMHKKVRIILIHDYIKSDNQYWVKRDDYEKAENNSQFEQSPARVWLTDTDSIIRNVYS